VRCCNRQDTAFCPQRMQLRRCDFTISIAAKWIFLLSDVVLPGETGWTLACKLRRENPFVKILLITGYAEQMGLNGGEARGVFGQAVFY
jgi:CheY-like chemotaxis protein